jgi:MmyB-like transcription regulator ligand binding domain
VIRWNDGARVLAAALFPDPPDWAGTPLNLLRLTLHPRGLRTRMSGWEAWASALLRRARREAAVQGSPGRLAAVLDEVEAYPGVAALAGDEDPAPLLVRAAFRLAGREVVFASTVLVLGEAHDLTAAELRIETLWPVDATAASAWREVTGEVAGVTAPRAGHDSEGVSR